MEPEIIISTNNLSIKQVVLFANKKVGFFIGDKTIARVNEYRNNLAIKLKENKNKFDIKNFVYNDNGKDLKNSLSILSPLLPNKIKENSNEEIKINQEQIKNKDQLPQTKPSNNNSNNSNNNDNNNSNNNNNNNNNYSYLNYLNDNNQNNNFKINLNENLIIQNSSIVSNDYIPDKVLRASLLIQLNLLSSGTSGISLLTLDSLIKRLKEDNLPLVIDNCSNGNSDSISLSQASLPLIGKSISLPNGKIPKVIPYPFLSGGCSNDIDFNGDNNQTQCSSSSSDNNNDDGDDLINSLKENEQLSILETNSLINGNCITLASGALTLNDVSCFLNALDTSASFAMEAFRVNLNSLNSVVSKVHNQNGQVQCSNNFQNILNFSKLWSSSDNQNNDINNNNQTNDSNNSGNQTPNLLKDKKCNLIDPMSFRNVSQIHGAAYTSFDWCYGIFEKEMNLCVDNPLIQSNEDNGLPYTNGNIDSGLLSLSMDTLRLSLCRCIQTQAQRISKLPWNEFNNFQNFNSSGSVGSKQHTIEQQKNYHYQILNLCKIASSIVSTIQQLSQPVLTQQSGMQLCEGYEDTSSQAPLSIKNTKQLIEQGWKLITIEIIISIYCIKQRNISVGSIGFGLRSLFNSIQPLLPWSTSPPILRSPPMDIDQTSSSFISTPLTPSQILDTRSIQEIIKNYICDN
ncbi:hypothetical protein DDB_G0285259 [Dictyostelium discoideum AX4]|uniref:Uncharacterized protein n=1 Tax=Dictyostelium discoideum TaxID=44689 RepID=Q54NH3_DICDI|nr:hypothetical protein DDB_G0285259 [Dictyostelium discoideum AX4]EAL64793.1 hypothetical protein DDB_G0285259 [Dictyostelium discoideum AX4]|eukprot:XP_638296.1 hypothetical protein DDB_G0285259 [Dictyostelium discoideum AX4]